MSKINHTLFNAHEHALESDLGCCPECGSQLRVKTSSTGPFIGCSAYPSCQFTKALSSNQVTQIKLLEGSLCPECGSNLAVKKGRFGMFIGCSNYPNCTFIESTNKNEDTLVSCPKCSRGHLVEKTNKYGKRFYSCNEYPKCRYVVNYEPLDHSCPKCGWKILVLKKGRKACPQPMCDFVESED